MNNKGQGLSITTIVVAAIALLILVVLVAVFTGQFGGFTDTVNSCRDAGGKCINDSKTDPQDNSVPAPQKECPESTPDCYVPLEESE